MTLPLCDLFLTPVSRRFELDSVWETHMQPRNLVNFVFLMMIAGGGSNLRVIYPQNEKTEVSALQEVMTKSRRQKQSQTDMNQRKLVSTQPKRELSPRVADRPWKGSEHPSPETVQAEALFTICKEGLESF